MDTNPSAPFTVVREGFGVTRYILPRRVPGKARWGGLILLAFGLFIVVFMLGWMASPLRDVTKTDGPSRWFLLVFGLLGLPGLAAGLGVSLLGIAIVANVSHAEVLVTGDRLVAVERIGILAWRRRRPLGAVARIALRMGLGEKRGETPSFMDLAVLVAEGARVRSMIVAAGYRPEALRALADALAAQIGVVRGEAELPRGSSPIAVPVIEGELARPILRESNPPPADTDINCEERLGYAAITVPPAGLRKGSHGLFFFGLVWTGFITILFAVFIAAAVGAEAAGPPAFAWLVVLLFEAIGIAMLASALNMGRRRTLLAVANDSLAYRCVGPFGTVEKCFAKADIASVVVGPSGLAVNDVPILELQIIPKAGVKLGLLSQRSTEELEWIADVLRRALGLGS